MDTIGDRLKHAAVDALFRAIDFSLSLVAFAVVVVVLAATIKFSLLFFS